MNASTGKTPILAADGTPLRKSLARSLRQQKLRALMLIAPLLVFIFVAFIMPIVSMLMRSVENDIVADTLPLTVNALQSWDAQSGELPDEAVYAAFAADIKQAALAKEHTKVGLRLNYEQSGIASLFKKTARAAVKWDIETDGPFKEKLLKIHRNWGNLEIWQALKVHSPEVTSGYFLNAVDMRKTVDGPDWQPEEKQILLVLFKRTLFMSLVITFSCIALGYPVAWLLANL
ncbi:MAG: ABC transporter permease, partial [Paracoccaceae bacterium]